MIFNIDVKSLEWCTYLQLSQDKVGIEEWLNVLEDPTKNDIHRGNQTAFDLPTRLIAKVFLFRWIYRGSAYAYSKDPDFAHVSRKVAFWEDVIERYYNKYNGLYKCHMDFIRKGTQTGQLVSPLGRLHKFQLKKSFDGSMQYSESDITNHPNQGLGADVTAMARVIARQRMKALKTPLKSILVNTVHDSIVLDGPHTELNAVANLFDHIFRDLPKIITQYYGVQWNVPLRAEVKYGPNMSDMDELVLDMS